MSLLSTQLRRHRHLALFGALAGIMLLHPFATSRVEDQIVLHFLLDVLILVCLFVTAKSRVLLAIGIGLGVPAISTYWLSYFASELGTISDVSLAAAADFLMAAFLLFVSVQVLISVFRAGEITSDRLFGAISVYLLLGLVWGYAYSGLELAAPGSFSYELASPSESTASQYTQDSLLFYYSFVTLTTLGFGDVVPQTPMAKSLTIWEAIVGQSYLAIVVARLVGLHIGQAYSQRIDE